MSTGININPNFGDISPSTNTNISTSGWYFTNSIGGLPEEAVPFMLAQGYEVNGVFPVPDINGNLVNVYSMARTRLNNAAVVHSLLTSFTEAYHEGRQANETRYSDILNGMKELLTDQQNSTESIASDGEIAGAITAAITDINSLTADAPNLGEWTSALEMLNAKLDEYDSAIGDLVSSYNLETGPINAAVTGSFTRLTNALAAYRNEVSTLRSGQATIQASIQSLLSAENADLAGHETDITQALDALDGQYSTQLAAANSALTALETAIGNFASDTDSIIAGMNAAQSAHVGTINTLTAQSQAAITTTGNELDSLMALLRSGYASHVTAMNAKIDDARTSFNAKDGVMDGLSASLASDYVDHAAKINQLILDAQTRFNARDTALGALTTNLRSDFTTHSGLATSFLDGLGATETARINEQFDNLRASNYQALTARGFYSSAMIAQMEAQVERERSEALTALNDRLNREKWENQHRLYEQQRGMRGVEIDVTQQLAGLEQQTIQARTGAADALQARQQASRGAQIGLTQQSASMEQQVIQSQTESTDRLFARQLEMYGLNVGVVQQFGGLQQQSIQFRTEATDRVNARALEIGRLSLQARQETERIRTELSRLKVGVTETFTRVFTDIKSQVVGGLTQLQQARIAVSRGQAEDLNRIFTQLAEVSGRALAGEDRFAGLDAQLSQQQQQILATIEELKQSWARTRGDLLATGINVRGESARIDASVRQAYYDVLLRQRAEAADSRLRAAFGKAEMLGRHIDQSIGVATALFGFVERREDSYPGLGAMAQVAASLGESGSSAWRST